MAATIDFQALFEAWPNASLLLDRELRIVAANAAYLSATATELGALLGRSVFEAAPDGPADPANESVQRLRASLEKVLATGQPDVLPLLPYRVPLHTPQGPVVEERFWTATHTPVRDERGEVAFILQHNADVTRQQKFEQQLIGIVSHDLRNPLHAISMSAALLLRRGSLDAQQGKAVARIISSSERAGRLIRDFLDFTQARSVGRIPVQPGPANLRELSRQVVDEVNLAHPERQAIVEHQGDESGRWDGDRIAQVIGNLVGNAFQHSPPDAAIRVSSRIEGDEARIEVHNQGAAISKVVLERLFEPFQRGENAKGASGRSVGLGLFIAREIVAAHGGRIEVVSGEGGTTFLVRLPRESAEPQAG